jgi:hypothetical protein
MSYEFDTWMALCDERERYGTVSPVNIFYLDPDPDVAAAAHCDTHVVKMLLESAQLLSTAWHVGAPHLLEEQPWPVDAPYRRGTEPGEFWTSRFVLRGTGLRVYRRTHVGHPCAEWVRASVWHYDWVWRLASALADEYTHRFKRTHASAAVVAGLELPPPGTRDTGMTEPPCAMPAEFLRYEGRCVDAVASYRAYYCGAKRALLRYTNREIPPWIAAATAEV